MSLEVAGISIYVLHDLQQLDLKPESAGFAAVVSGHGHIPRQTKNGVLYFNPGSAGPRRFWLPTSVGWLVDVERGKLIDKILEWQRPRSPGRPRPGSGPIESSQCPSNS